MPQRALSRAIRIGLAWILGWLLGGLVTPAGRAAEAATGHAAEPATVIRGAGATFPAPLYVAWAAAYHDTGGARVEYDAVGSGRGIDEIKQRAVDFGASDAPLTPEDAAAAGLLQFPAVIGGVAPVINITGIKPAELVLDGGVLADIYLGRIRKWNDPSIARLNPTVALPNTHITVVHRGDASGSSLLWTDYLSRSSPEWRQTVGASLEPHWPVGVAGTGNEGVASYVQRTRFAIGYVEYAFARAHHLSDIALRNHEGRIVRAGHESFAAAADMASWDDLAHIRQMPTDLSGARSWPITGASFILVPEHDPRSAAVVAFFGWALHSGGAILRRLAYTPLPRSAVEQLPGLWAKLPRAAPR